MGLVAKFVRLAALAAFVGFATEERVFAVEATLVADAHVNSARPTANSGAISNLNVGGGYTALLQFDLGTVPAGTTASQISRALLRLYCNRADTVGLVSVQPVTSGWGEYSVTYSSLPQLAAVTQVVSVAQTGAYVWVDVTTLVQGWVTAPSTNNGLAMTAASAAVQFDSKENDLTGHAPLLDIVLASQGPVGPKGDTGATGVTGPVGPQGSVGPAGSIGLQGPQGPKGDTGVPGPAGATGPAGVPGIAGPQGPSGPAGARGPAGSPGLIYQGTYSFTVNYALGDVVLWQGASYVSLSGANHGNAPSLNPSQWGVLTAQGPTGPQGATGATGATGFQGPPGSVGPQGLQGIPGQAGAQGIQGPSGQQGAQGPAGPQGPVGPVGMSFRGGYSSTTNYAVGDGISWGNSGYVSLIDNNHGNTPDQSPSAWGVFATGTPGAVGLTGPAGQQGVQGVMGAAGSQGATGPQGPVGPQGPAVANYTGNYSSTTNYGLHDAVSYDGSTYISLIPANAGHAPAFSPSQWAVLAAQGPAGAAGAPGSTGPQGAVGPTGAAGPAGLAGPQGPPVSFKGAWQSLGNYVAGDTVSYGGGSYIALVASVNRQPDANPVYWSVLAQAGVAGAAGTQGPQGLQGPAGVSFKGAWSPSTGYLPHDAVLYNGSTYLALATNLGLLPDTVPAVWSVLAQAGSAGATGPSGSAATVSIGSVTTGVAGTSASVVNTGTQSAAILNFVIPQGAPGASGSGSGSSGTSGVPFASVYHAVSFSSIYYSVNSPTASNNETDQVLTWLPDGCTASKLTVYSRQVNTITVTLRSGVPTAMASSALSCAVANNGTCTATGSVTIPPGGFIDLIISGANGTSAGVWTALACE